MRILPHSQIKDYYNQNQENKLKIITIKTTEINEIAVPENCPTSSISELLEFLSIMDTDGFDIDNFTIDRISQKWEILTITKNGGSNETNTTSQEWGYE